FSLKTSGLIIMHQTVSVRWQGTLS
ncbi:unnamed protein product, partial [Rotaria magnacalcarata]